MRLNFTISKKLALIIWALIITFLFWCISSCSAQHRLNRLLSRHPELAHRDTLIYHDTLPFMFPGVAGSVRSPLADVLRGSPLSFSKQQLHATVRIEHDTVFLDAKCDTIRDTVIRALSVPYDKFTYRRPRDGLSWFWVLFIVIAVSSFNVYLSRKK